MKNSVKLQAKTKGFILEADGQTFSIGYTHVYGHYYEVGPSSEQALNLIYKYKSEVNKFLDELGKEIFSGSYWIGEPCEDCDDCANTFSFKGGKIVTKYAWKSFKNVTIKAGISEFLEEKPSSDNGRVKVTYYNDRNRSYWDE